MKKIKIGIRDLIGLICSIFFLWLTVRKVSIENIDFKFDASTIIYLVLSCIFVTLPTFVNAFRFRVFFENHPYKTGINPIPSFFIGNFYNAILPGNMGEVVKLYHFGRKYQIRKKDLLAYWMLEKFLGAALLPFLFLYPLLVIEDKYVKIGLAILIIIVFSAFLFVLFAYKSRYVKRLFFVIIPFLKTKQFIYGVFCNFLFVLGLLIKDNRIFRFWGYTALYFIGILVFIYFTIKATDLPLDFASLEGVMLLCAIAMVSNFVPSMPSSAGIMHYGIYSAFLILATHYNITVTSVLINSFVIAAAIFHLIIFVVEVSLGIPFVWRERKWLFARKKDVIQRKNELVFK